MGTKREKCSADEREIWIWDTRCNNDRACWIDTNPSSWPNEELIEDKNRENRIEDGTNVIRRQMQVHDHLKTSEK